MKNKFLSELRKQYTIVAVDDYNQIPSRIYISKSTNEANELTEAIAIDLIKPAVYSPQKLGSYLKFMCPLRKVLPEKDDINEMWHRINNLPESIINEIDKTLKQKIMNKNFYFKFREGNIGFMELMELMKSKDIDEKNIPLPIYFGKWTKEQYYLDYETLGFHKNHISKSQVDWFFNLSQTKNQNIYFWIFLPDYVYVLQLNEPYSIFDFPTEIPKYLKYSTKDESIPKFYRGRIIDIIEKNALPECFANLNSNQKYNRLTIREFEGIENDIANYLVNKDSKLSIKNENKLQYLSPLQFETLIFLIFVENNIYCSTYRGGTKEKYDLKIENDKKIFDEFDDGPINIQIKMKKEFSKPKKDDEKTVFVYLGNTKKEDRLFGSDWIYKEVEKSEYIKNWLKKSLEFFTIE